MKQLEQTEAGLAHLALIALIALVLVGGAGVYVVSHNKSKAPKASLTETEKASTLPDPLPTDLLTVDAVKDLAKTVQPSATVAGVELENEDGALVYKVKLTDGTTLLFNAQTGARITPKTEAEAETPPPASLPTNAPAIGFDQARTIALQQRPGKTITKIELETEEGKAVYSVRFSDGGRVDVDATSGKVVRVVNGTTTAPAPGPATTNGSDDTSGSSGSGSGSGDDGSHSGSGSGSDSGSGGGDHHNGE